MTILLIEDEKKLSDILKRALTIEHYSVDVAYDGEEGLAKATKNSYSLILLDIMLPKKDGFQVCKELRDNQIHTPIIMLTAMGSELDKVKGLDVGADDYLVKPFGMNELSARVRAIMRRRKIIQPDIQKISDLIMDKRRHEVTRGGKVIHLTPKEYKILETLFFHRGEAVTRRVLIDSAWEPEFEEENNELNVHIKYLRNKINGKKDIPLIHTIRGVGFMLKE